MSEKIQTDTYRDNAPAASRFGVGTSTLGGVEQAADARRAQATDWHRKTDAQERRERGA